MTAPPPPFNQSHDVFISYSGKDKATADAICEHLETQGIKCWIAPRDIQASDSYSGAIVEAIKSSRIFILVFSSNSNSSNDVKQEVERAFQNEIPILPFRVENVQPSTDLEYFLSTPQWLNALTPPLEFHLDNLVDAVGALLKIPRKTKRKEISRFSTIPKKIFAGIALVLVIAAVLYFDPFKLFSSGDNGPKPVDFDVQFKEAVGRLSSASSQEQLEGLRLLDKIAKTGGEYWYWQVMGQLTNYVREHAPWKGQGGCIDQPPKTRPAALQSILEVISAQPPVYPTHFKESNKDKQKRNLKCTDLRGLRLVNQAHLEYVDLQGSNLDGAVLTGAAFNHSILKDASLVNTDLGSTILEGVDFAGADLGNANLRAAKGLNINYLMLADRWWCAGLSDDVWNQIRSKLQEQKEEIPEEGCS